MNNYIQCWVNLQNLIYWKIDNLFLKNKVNFDEIIKTYNSSHTKINTEYKLLNIKYIKKNKEEIQEIEEYFVEEYKKNHEDEDVYDDDVIIQKIYEEITDYNYIQIFFKYYYFIFKSLQDNTVYIIFYSREKDIILEKEELYGEEIKIMIQQLIEYMNSLRTEINTFCLCGHSLGCVFAQLVGLEIMKQDPTFFQSSIYIIGSAPFKWIKEEDILLYRENYRENKIKIHTLVIDNTTPELIRIDPIYNSGDLELYQAYPLELIKYNNKREIIKIETIYDSITINSYLLNNIHNWSFYESLFINPLDIPLKKG